ncbi:MAG TPA: Calx-beta domain-containing protein [Thermoanaerobaculia bacterium]|nr:Calx-beta domain-containing protein [Thermoanaerobaculia bacterium]
MTATRALTIAVAAVIVVVSPAARGDLFFEQHAVAARVTPGAQTAWFATTNDWEAAERATVIRQYASLVTDTDGDGLVRFDLGTRIMPVRGTWLVVDMTSGQIHSGANQPSARAPSRFPGGAFLRDPAGHFTNLSIDYSSALWTTYLWVRPGVGAWFLWGGDGWQHDLDGARNQRMFFQTSSMEPLAPSPPPPEEGIKPGDLFLALDYFGEKWFGDEVSSHLAESVGAGAVGFGKVTTVRRNERLGVVRLAVIRTGGSDGAVSVNYATVDGTLRAGAGYLATAGRLTFGAGELIQFIDVPILHDAVDSGEAFFQLVLSDPAGTTIEGSPTVTITIVNDDSPLPARRRSVRR